MVTERPRWTLDFYTDARGKSPVLEFINGQPVRDRAKVHKDLRLLRQFGTQLGMPHARPLAGHKPKWELRPGAIRLLYFAHTGRRFIILHAFRKKGRKIPPGHIATAQRYMAEFLEGEK